MQAHGALDAASVAMTASMLFSRPFICFPCTELSGITGMDRWKDCLSLRRTALATPNCSTGGCHIWVECTGPRFSANLPLFSWCHDWVFELPIQGMVTKGSDTNEVQTRERWVVVRGRPAWMTEGRKEHRGLRLPLLLSHASQAQQAWWVEFFCRWNSQFLEPIK